MVWRRMYGHRQAMTTCSFGPPIPPLRPVLRQHLVQLQAAPITLRLFNRADLPRWRAFDDRRSRGILRQSGVDEEARFLAGVHRSRLQQDNDQLLLGVFDDRHGMLHDQLQIQLHSAHARCAELRSMQHSHEHPAQALQALCPFLFDQVGLHRVFTLLPVASSTPFVDALRAVGFEHEGLLRDHHLDIDGWQDRQLLALTAPRWRQQVRPD